MSQRHHFAALAIASACLLGACSDNNRNDNARARDDAVRQPSDDAAPMNVSPETRILSILHDKNRQEIRIGRMAQEKGVSQGVRRFGDMLVSDHTTNDEQVNAIARNANISLLQPNQVRQMLAREKGLSAPPPNPGAELANLSGSEFDRVFAQKMLEGHRELIQIVEAAQREVRDPEVRDLLNTTLPRLREHENMASRLVREG